MCIRSQIVRANVFINTYAPKFYRSKLNNFSSFVNHTEDLKLEN